MTVSHYLTPRVGDIILFDASKESLGTVGKVRSVVHEILNGLGRLKNGLSTMENLASLGLLWISLWGVSFSHD